MRRALPAFLLAALLSACAGEVIPTYEQRMARGQAHFTAARWPEARMEFEFARNFLPLDPFANFYLAECFYQEGRYDETIAPYRTALQGGRFPTAWGRLAYAWFVKGDYGAAADCYGKAILEDPSDPRRTLDFHANLGHCYEKMNRIPEAMAEFDLVRARDPGYAEAYVMLCRIEAIHRRNERGARVFYDQLKRIHPTHEKLRIMEEWITTHRGDIEPTPANRGTEFLQRGRVLASDGNFKAAAAEFERAIAENPENAEAHLHLGRARVETLEFDASIAAYERTLRLRGEDAQTLFELGAVHRQKGDLVAAARVWKRAIELDPLNEKAAKALEGLK